MNKSDDIQLRIEELRAQVGKLQEAVRSFTENGFPRETLVLLLKKQTAIRLDVIRKLLDGIESLDELLYEEEAE